MKLREPGESYRLESEKIAARLAAANVDTRANDENAKQPAVEADEEVEENYTKYKEGQLKFTKLLNEAKAHGRKTKTILDDVEKGFGLKLQKMTDYKDAEEEAQADLLTDCNRFMRSFKDQ